MKILVIDRDAQFAALIAFALERAAYEICLAADRRTALRQLLLAGVWEDSSRSTQQMLKQLIYRLRQKLEADPSRPQLIVTSPGAGYRLID